MKTSIQRFSVITNDSAPRHAAEKVAAVVIALCFAILFALSLWATWGTGPAEPAPEAQLPGVGDAALSFDYFPAQYVNQAKEPEEHIQAF